MALFELINKDMVNKIAKGIKILQNNGIFGLRKRLAPAGSVLPNSFIYCTEIPGKQYLASIS